MAVSALQIVHRHLRSVSAATIQALHVLDDVPAGTDGSNELDTHAEAAALGANWRVLDTNGELVDVSGFSNELSTLTNIPIVRAGSVYLDPATGAEYLLVIDQAMYFGSRMSHSLINPNQIRHYGHSLCDDPYDLLGYDNYIY